MWHKADLASVLVAVWCLDDEERRERLVQKGDQMRAAQLFALAMWDGKRLNAEVTQHLSALCEPTVDGHTNGVLIEAARAYLAGADQHRKVS